ncbi:hypothetical protein [Photobacterium sp. OFAV2-7]|uniref:hypothetical protein n=1 Tax=Photobacterium sp. OFAV2-7 TaxID=2917748 RepID=UPI001EF4515E|nr:hypothetical protein [Photobacterium sp. OFAV2-7]MCG7588767.1 hypothetical protein [Photobacterium sp. OFAV2-7]
MIFTLEQPITASIQEVWDHGRYMVRDMFLDSFGHLDSKSFENSHVTQWPHHLNFMQTVKPRHFCSVSGVSNNRDITLNSWVSYNGMAYPAGPKPNWEDKITFSTIAITAKEATPASGNETYLLHVQELGPAFQEAQKQFLQTHQEIQAQKNPT